MSERKIVREKLVLNLTVLLLIALVSVLYRIIGLSWTSIVLTHVALGAFMLLGWAITSRVRRSGRELFRDSPRIVSDDPKRLRLPSGAGLPPAGLRRGIVIAIRALEILLLGSVALVSTGYLALPVIPPLHLVVIFLLVGLLEAGAQRITKVASAA